MTASKLSDETLMAYADGELPDVEADAVTVAAALDPEVARRVALFKASSRIAKAAFDPVLGEPVPPHLREAVLALGTHASGRKRAPRRSWLDWVIPEGSVTPWAGVAAALGCVLGIAVGWQLASLRSVPGAAPSLAASVAPLPAELLEVLERQPTGHSVLASLGARTVQVLPLASYGDAASFCREVEVSSTFPGRSEAVRAIACRTDGKWRLAAMAGPGTARAQAGDYQPAAGSRDLAAALGFGEPLSEAEEARYLKAAR
jgi:anti-sigma factor RsiW